MRTSIASIAICFAVLAGSAGAAAPAPAAAAATPGKPPTPPAPCEDFYLHANAAWLADPAAPASVFAALQAQSVQRQRALLDAAASAPADDIDRQLGTFWRAANDEAAIEAAGTRALKPWLDRAEQVKKPADVAALLASAHAAGLPLLFRFDVGADLREPARTVAYARQGGLGLPDRDYYLRQDPATEALRTHYRAYVGRLLALAGTPAGRIAADVAAIMDIESRLARSSLSLVQLRDPNNSWLPSELRDVDDRYGHLDWKGFLRAQGLRKLRGLSLAHTSFFVEADHLVGALPPAQWRAYLRFHLLHALAPHLPRQFRDAHFALFGRQLQGLDAPPPRWQQALEATDTALGEWLGERYAARHLAPADAARATAIAKGLVEALRQRLAAAAWLGAEARAAGAAKLDALTVVVGHDDPAPAGKLPALAADDHAANMLAAAAWRQESAFARLGEAPVPAALRGHRANAFYDPAANRLAVSAAMLAPPLLSAPADPARDHGALGALLGHDLSHAVDLQGSTIAADGSAKGWWSAEDYQRFTERTKGLVAQYDAYPALADVKVDGRRTFLENLADLAGLELAWDAFLGSTPDADADARRRFFEAFANAWGQRTDERALRLALATDVRAPARWRVLGALANFGPFADTFACSAGASFVRAPDQRIAVWH